MPLFDAGGEEPENRNQKVLQKATEFSDGNGNVPVAALEDCLHQKPNFDSKSPPQKKYRLTPLVLSAVEESMHIYLNTGKKSSWRVSNQHYSGSAALRSKAAIMALFHEHLLGSTRLDFGSVLVVFHNN